MTARDVLRNEVEAGEESFLLQLREFYWDWEAFRRLTSAMYDVADEVNELPTIERWIAEGFWFCDTWIRSHTSHPNFRRPSEKEYEEALELLNALAWYLFSGVSLYQGDLLRRKAKGE